MHWAVKLRSLKVVSELLKHRKAAINVNAVDLTRSTALHYAAYYGIPEVLSQLLEHGADVKLKDADDLTAYDLVCLGMTSSHVTTAIMLHPYYNNSNNNGDVGKDGAVGDGESTPSPMREHPLLRAVSNNLITQFQMAKTVVVEKMPKKAVSAATLSKGFGKTAGYGNGGGMQRSSSAPTVRISNAEQAELAHKLSYTWKKDVVDPHGRTVLLDNGTQIEAPLYELPFQPLHSRFDIPSILAKLPYPKGAMGMSAGNQSNQLQKQQGMVVIVSVEQCHDCASHGWNLRHNEEQYQQHADDALMQSVCTLLNANDLNITVFAFKHRAPKDRTGALEIVVSMLVPDSRENQALLSKTYKPKKRPVSASKPSPTRPLSTDYAGKPVFKNPSFTNGVVLPTPAPPVLYEADKQSQHNRQRRTKHGNLWVHHVLHSKLATQTWPVLDKVAHELLATVRSFASPKTSMHNINPLASSSGSTDAAEKDVPPMLASMSKSMRALSVAKMRSPTIVANGKHEDNVFYYNLWYDRMFESSEPSAATGTVTPSLPGARTPTQLPVASSPISGHHLSLPKSVVGSAAHSALPSAICSPIVSARRGSGEINTGRSELHSTATLSGNGSLELSKVPVPETIPEPATSVPLQSDAARLLELANHVVSPVRKKKEKKPCLPCFLGYINRPEEEKDYYKESKQRKKDMTVAYEDQVLSHFFVFDNNV